MCRVPLPEKNRVGRLAKLLIFAKHVFTIIFRLKFRVVKVQMSECIVIYSKYAENTVERSAEEDWHGGSMHDAPYKSYLLPPNEKVPRSKGQYLVVRAFDIHTTS